MQARIMNRLALLRGIRSVENDHFLSEVYSGLPRTAGNRRQDGRRDRDDDGAGRRDDENRHRPVKR